MHKSSTKVSLLYLYLLPLFSISASAASSYKWPSPQYDALETLLYEGRRSDGSSLSSLVAPCRKRASTGTSVPAEWLRFAFHDMATHNVDDGTGGLDGSIVYELNAPENFGEGFIDTLSDFSTFPNKAISRADVIAIGAIMGVATCGGPTIPFRAGRMDVWKGGSSDNAPIPEDDINTLKDSFRKMGFTQEEMIQLTACGHTMGAVRSTDFPQLVPPTQGSTTPVVKDFDGTTQFDNAIVTEYLDGSTQNVLVVTSNATMASDLRVFSSDGNSTMKGIADANKFKSTCQTLLQRMIEVVPKDVTLTDEITLIPAKVNSAALSYENKKFVFKTELRLNQALNQTVSSKRTVTLLWCAANGTNKDCADSAFSAIPVSNMTDDASTISPLATTAGVTFAHYQFVVPIDTSSSISKFWFEVNEGDGKSATTYNNGGDGYKIDQDSIFFVPMLSHVDSVANTSPATMPGSSPTPAAPLTSGTSAASAAAQATTAPALRRRGGGPIGPALPQNKVYNLVIAVKSSLAPSRVYVDSTDVATPNFTQPFSQTFDLQKSSSLPAQDGYDFWTGGVTSPGAQLMVDIHAVASGQTISQTYVPTLLLDNTPQVDPSNVTMVKGKKTGGALRVGEVIGSVWLALLPVVMAIGASVM
ncbi:L-ascorbate oxidase [Crepidotus variabilis]|uniref:Peroxidase n=1 Tax=Crepidotus variabilis TaxID=179855 RepID=A0A9P6ELX6_9AGAR|nr:L-ascorbate oxidase [Crepidotus variabilis]